MHKLFMILVMLTGFDAAAQTNTSTTTNAHTIQGAFGFKLGEAIDISSLRGTGRADGYFEVTPPTPNPLFDLYRVEVTPQTHLIFAIGASKRLPRTGSTQEDSRAELRNADTYSALCELFREKYDPDRRQPSPDPLTNSFTLTQGDRLIWVKELDAPFLWDLESLPNELSVTYIDRKLGAIASKEETEIQRAKLKSDADKLDPAGL